MPKFLGSVKLTIVLLILLVATSIIGTLIPQTWTEQQYRERYGNVRYQIMKSLQLLDVYHSYWFSALLAVLCINMVVCSIQGFGPLVKSLTRSSSTAGRVTIPDLPFYEKIKLSGGSTETDRVIQKIKDTFSRGLYKVKYTDAENGVYYFERGKLGRLGPLVTHASIIIILVGGIIVARFGFKGYENIPEGSTIYVPRSPISSVGIEAISSVGIEAIVDLNHGSISENLRRELKDNKIPLSDDATVSVEAANFKWNITDGDKVYIVNRHENELDIYSYADLQLIVDLNHGSISENLRQKLKNSSISLSDDATVLAEAANFKWNIVDGDKVYIVKRHENELEIYSYAGFQLRVDDFDIEFYPNNSPKEFTSKLTVIEDGAEKLKKTIEVNSPLKYKGVKFYQSGYGPMNAATETRTEVVGKFKVDIEEEFHVPDSQLKIKVANLVPDFVRDGEGHVSSRSDKPNNPAAFLELYEGDEPEPIYRVWSFLKFPDFHGTGESDYALKFLSMDSDTSGMGHTLEVELSRKVSGKSDERYYTGLQIRSHPGLPIIWAGCLMMVAGMFLSFYMSFKRVWVRVSDDSVEMGGRSYKNRSGFEKEFERLKGILEHF